MLSDMTTKESLTTSTNATAGEQNRQYSLKRRQESTVSHHSHPSQDDHDGEPTEEGEDEAFESARVVQDLNFDFDNEDTTEDVIINNEDDFDADEMMSRGGGRSRAVSVLDENEANVSFDPRGLIQQRELERNDNYSEYGNDGALKLSRKTLDTLQVLDATPTGDHHHHLDSRRHLPPNYMSSSMPDNFNGNGMASSLPDPFNHAGLRAREAAEEAALVEEERRMNNQRTASAVAALAVVEPTDKKNAHSVSHTDHQTSSSTRASTNTNGEETQKHKLGNTRREEGKKETKRRQRRASGIWRSSKPGADGCIDRSNSNGIPISAVGRLPDMAFIRGGRRRHSALVTSTTSGSSLPTTETAGPSLSSSSSSSFSRVLPKGVSKGISKGLSMGKSPTSPPWIAAAARQFTSSKTKVPWSYNSNSSPVSTESSTTSSDSKAGSPSSPCTFTDSAVSGGNGELLVVKGNRNEESMCAVGDVSAGVNVGGVARDLIVKVLLLGDSNVGKTSLMTRAADNVFQQRMMSTAGVDYKSFKLEGITGVNGSGSGSSHCSNVVRCQIWDTAGQERFHVITRSYYKGCQTILVVYDVTNPKSLDHVGYWVGNIRNHANGQVVVGLVGNKTDVPLGERMVSEEQGRQAALEWGVPYYFECSAKSGQNVKNVFEMLARAAVQEIHRKQTGATQQQQQQQNQQQRIDAGAEENTNVASNNSTPSARVSKSITSAVRPSSTSPSSANHNGVAANVDTTGAIDVFATPLTSGTAHRRSSCVIS